MIKLTKGPAPEVLVQNQAVWTAEMEALIAQYGSYSTIPDNEKDSVLNHYRHVDIKNALESDSGGKKCVYCESSLGITSYSNIEHFYPKSLYPSHTFCWDNLFMGCTLCNSHKDNFDTVNRPFIHPLNDDPEEYLTFDELRIVPKCKNPDSDDYKKAENVIRECNLKHRLGLTTKYAGILAKFYGYSDSLESAIRNYNSLSQNAAKRNIAVNMLESLNTLKFEASVNAEYAGYMRYLLRKFDVIRQAVSIINTYSNDLVPCTGFDWRFRFDY